MKRCYLVRHAQTCWNSENRLQGHSDLPLNPLGHQQAQRLAAFFASVRLRGIFTSPLTRSRQTAHAIVSGNGHQLIPVIEAGLAEMHLGAWEGLTPEEVNARYAGAYDRWRIESSVVTIPSAEPLAAFRARARGAFDRIVGDMADGEYVVVSHGGVIAALLADVLRADYDALLRRLQLDNGGITAIECGWGTPYVLWVNATTHLSSVPPAVPASAGGQSLDGAPPSKAHGD